LVDLPLGSLRIPASDLGHQKDFLAVTIAKRPPHADFAVAAVVILTQFSSALTASSMPVIARRPILACTAELKYALLGRRRSRFRFSSHWRPEEPETLRAYRACIGHFGGCSGFGCRIVAYDLHPELVPGQWRCFKLRPGLRSPPLRIPLPKAASMQGRLNAEFVAVEFH
jgi:hypothetical protein